MKSARARSSTNRSAANGCSLPSGSSGSNPNMSFRCGFALNVSTVTASSAAM